MCAGLGLDLLSKRQFKKLCVSFCTRLFCVSQATDTNWIVVVVLPPGSQTFFLKCVVSGGQLIDA